MSGPRPLIPMANRCGASTCGQKPQESDACEAHTIVLDGLDFHRLEFAPDEAKQNIHSLDANRCRYCGVVAGNAHHLGCAYDECPNRGRYLMTSCTCLG
jgi:hypothetical protein